MRCNELGYMEYGLSVEDPDNNGILWRGMGETAIAFGRKSGGTFLETSPTRIIIKAPTMLHEYKKMLNASLPEELQISAHKERWYVRNNITNRSWVYWWGMEFVQTPHYAARIALPTPDKTGISKPVQRLVKRWASRYKEVSNNGMCGLCAIVSGRPMAAVFADGKFEREHVLDHVLSGTLPRDFMFGVTLNNPVVKEWDLADAIRMSGKAAQYTIAVHYAYNLLRRTHE